MTKLISKKQKNSLFPKKKSLIGLPPGVNYTNILWATFWYKNLLSSFFCTYLLGLYFFVKRILAQKLLVKNWWNWPQNYIKGFVFLTTGWVHFPITAVVQFIFHIFKIKTNIIKNVSNLSLPHFLCLASVHKCLVQEIKPWAPKLTQQCAN